MNIVLALALVAAADMPSTQAAKAEPRGSNVTVPQNPDALDRRVDQATDLIFAKRPAEAVALLDKLIPEYEAQHPPKQGIVYYSARSMSEAIVYASLVMGQNADAIVTDRNWGEAYFLKGFALIDLNRSPEALAWFDKAITLAPMNAHFLNERAEWHKSRRDWDKAYEGFERASDAAAFSEDDVKPAEKARALRGMAFSRIEQGRFEEAEKLLKEALKAKPGDEKVLQELDYIKGLKNRS